jgi:hydroxymethylbilane synthase
LKIFRIATRRSPLAQAQTQLVADAIRRACPELTVETVTFETTGDLTQGELSKVGGKGLFTLELERALLAGDVDAAVHSAKDLPATLDETFSLSSVMPRGDVRDALVTEHAGGLAGLPTGATVGTGSLRRKVQLEALRPDVVIVPIRGNVQTRLAKVMKGDMDAVVLAQAGVVRSGLAEAHGDALFPLSPEEMLPAAGQGILAIETRVDDKETERVLERINDPETLSALRAERSVVAAVDADCHSCLAVYASIEVGQWRVQAMAADVSGRTVVRADISDPDSVQAGIIVAEALLSQGAKQLLSGEGSSDED